MKSYESTAIRNVALAGHAGAGKTSLVEAILYSLKQADRLGGVTAGTTMSDYDPEEIRRQHSINASLLPAESGGVKINFLDLPGRRDFVGDAKNCLRAADAMVLVLDATGPIEVGVDFAVEYADEAGVAARAAFINKMDKERADFDKTLAELAARFPNRRAIPVVLPVGKEAGFKGVIDLVRMKLVEEKDRKVSHAEIPADLAAAASAARAKMVEAAAEGDEELMMKFLDDQPLSEEEIIKGLKEGIGEGRFCPVLCGSSTAMLGLASLLSLIGQCFPNALEGTSVECKQGEEALRIKASPEGTASLFIFKTVSDPYAGHLSFFKVMRGTAKSETSLLNLNRNKSQRISHVLSVCGKKATNIDSMAAGDLGAIAKLDATHTGDTLAEADGGPIFSPTHMPKPVIRMAVVPKGKADEDKIGIGLHRLVEQDPTLKFYRDPLVHQTILEGMGDVHLDVAVHHLKEASNVEVELQVPMVPYRETITRKAEAQGKHKKQSGGRGQYGDCWIRVEPLPEGSGFQFEWGIVGGVIPTKYAPAIEKGLIESLEKGALSAHPTVDFKAICYDGSFHDVDSSEMAFKVAASLAFKNVIPKAGPIILEPILKATILIPEEFMGDVMGNLNGKRGRILGMEADGKRQRIVAQVPMAEMFNYSRELRSMTRGAGVFETEFDHYSRVPPEVQDKLVASAQHHEKAEE